MNIQLTEARARGDAAPPGIGFSGGIGTDPWADAKFVNLGLTWDFNMTGRFLWTYLFGKLNTNLHSKSVSIENRNGFELYRLVVTAIDKIPENAKFLMGADLTAWRSSGRR